MNDPIVPQTDDIKLQLGQVIGTLKATVTAVENLRVSVERLAERAVIRADFDNELRALDERINSLGSKVARLQNWVWVATGVVTAIGFILRYIHIPVRVAVGGG